MKQSENLGVIFEPDLSFDSHFKQICKNVFFHFEKDNVQS